MANIDVRDIKKHSGAVSFRTKNINKFLGGVVQERIATGRFTRAGARIKRSLDKLKNYNKKHEIEKIREGLTNQNQQTFKAIVNYHTIMIDNLLFLKRLLKDLRGIEELLIKHGFKDKKIRKGLTKFIGDVHKKLQIMRRLLFSLSKNIRGGAGIAGMAREATFLDLRFLNYIRLRHEERIVISDIKIVEKEIKDIKSDIEKHAKKRAEKDLEKAIGKATQLTANTYRIFYLSFLMMQKIINIIINTEEWVKEIAEKRYEIPKSYEIRYIRVSKGILNETEEFFTDLLRIILIIFEYEEKVGRRARRI